MVRRRSSNSRSSRRKKTSQIEGSGLLCKPTWEAFKAAVLISIEVGEQKHIRETASKDRGRVISKQRLPKAYSKARCLSFECDILNMASATAMA